jgi:hypothetical protein
MRGFTNSATALAAISLVLVATSACSPGQKVVAYDYPKGSSESDPAFIQAMKETKLPDAIRLATDLEEADRLPAPKGEFETTPEYEARIAKTRPGPYDATVYAIAAAADFIYDADTGKISFNSAGGDDMLKLQQLRIDPQGPTPDRDWWEVKLPRDKAMGLPHFDGVDAELRRVIVFSMQGLERPIYSGPADLAEIQARLARNLVEDNRDAADAEAEHLVTMTATVKARILHAFVYDTHDGPEHPLYDWRPPG